MSTRRRRVILEFKEGIMRMLRHDCESLRVPLNDVFFKARIPPAEWSWSLQEKNLEFHITMLKECNVKGEGEDNSQLKGRQGL